MNTQQIAEIIRSNSHRIADAAYPSIPMGNTEIEFTLGSEDGEYTEKMDTMHLSFAKTYLVNGIAAANPVAMAHAALSLAMNEYCRKQICNSEADFYYDSDGHYETGNTPEKNRAKFWATFPTRNDFRAYAQEVSK